MGQKINPVALRLQQNGNGTRTFDASWYNDNFTTSFKTEQSIRNALVAFFHILSQTIPNQYLGRIFYQKSHKKTIVTFFFFKHHTFSSKKKLKKNRFLFKFSDVNYKKSQNKNLKVFNSKKAFVGQKKHTKTIFMKSFQSFSLIQIHSKNFKKTKCKSVLHKELIRVTFYSLLYTAFLRKKYKNVKDFFLLYFFTFLKIQNKTFKANDIVVHPFLRIFEHGLASFFGSNIYLRPILCRELNQSAIFIAEQIVQILQKNQKKKKMPGRLIKKLLQKLSSALFRGIRIMCSGRLAGAEMARKFFLKKGQTSLNVFSQKIDFAQKTVQTKYGIVGVKVWISFLR